MRFKTFLALALFACAAFAPSVRADDGDAFTVTISEFTGDPDGLLAGEIVVERFNPLPFESPYSSHVRVLEFLPDHHGRLRMRAAPDDGNEYIATVESFAVPEDGLLMLNALLIGIGGGGGPVDTTPPAAPTGLGLVMGESSISLDWSDNAEPDLAGYKIYRSTGASPINYVLIATIGATSAYEDTDVTLPGYYRYRVTACDASGNESDPSATANTPPVAVTDLAAEAGDGQATLTWTGGTGTNTFDAYVSESSGSGFTLVEADVSSPYVVASLDNGTPYYFHLVQNGSAGATPPTAQSNEATATPEAAVSDLGDLSPLAWWSPRAGLGTGATDAGGGEISALLDLSGNGIDLDDGSDAARRPAWLADEFGSGLHGVHVRAGDYLANIAGSPAENEFHVVAVISSQLTGYSLNDAILRLHADTVNDAAGSWLTYWNASHLSGYMDSNAINAFRYHSSNDANKPAVIMVSRVRNTGSADGVVAFREDNHLTGFAKNLTLADYSGGGKNIYLGTTTGSGSGVYGDVAVFDNEADALAAVGLLGTIYGKTLPNPASDLPGAVRHYAPRLAQDIAYEGTGDPATAVPDLLGNGVLGNAYTAAMASVADAFGSGLHGLQGASSKNITDPYAFPGGVNDFALLVAVIGPTSGSSGRVLTIGDSISDTTQSLRIAFASGAAQAVLYDATAGTQTITDGATMLSTPAVLRVERNRTAGTFRLYKDSVLIGEATGLSLDNWSTARTLFLGSGAVTTHIQGDVAIYTDLAAAATDEATLMAALGISAP